MDYRSAGRSGLKLSAIALGGWINFEAKIAEDEARGIIRDAIDGGVNFFDLADVYGNGRAEEWMGRLLSEYPRHTLVISTKVFFPMSDDPNDRGLSRKHIFESIDRSLKRLGTDYLDIYYCHRHDPETPLIETIRAMNDLIRAGKVLYWGTSMWPAEQIEEAHTLCERHGLVPPQVEQPVYSMLKRDWTEQTALPLAEKYGFGLTVYSPLGMGMLTGKYDEGIPDDSRFQQESWAAERYFTEDNVRRVRALKPIADGLGLTRTQLALAWALRQPGVSSVITGATKRHQIAESLGAAGVTLSADVAAAIEQALA